MGISLSHLCVWHFKYSMKQQGGLPTVTAHLRVAPGMSCRKEQYSLPHTFVLLQSSRFTSFSSPANVVVLAKKRHSTASQLWIKICWTQSRSLLWCPVLVLAEGSERLRPESRERGRGSLWLLNWLVLAEGAPGHGMVGLSTHSHQGAFRCHLFLHHT